MKNRNAEIEKAVYQKYIVPTQRPAKDYVGAEFELPIVNLKKQAVDFDVVHALARAFTEHFGFDGVSYDDAGDIYAAQNSENGDTLSFDCSYNTLELSFGKISDLHVIHERFREYYAFIQGFLTPHEHTLTGMGINPYRNYNRNEPIPNERYRMLLHHLNSHQKYGNGFHAYPMFGLFSAANQVQLDVEEADIPTVINTFNKLEPLKSILFSNSPLDGMYCSRDYLWKKSLHGLNPRNVDGYDRIIKDTSDIVSYIAQESIYCVMRNGRYIHFAPTPLNEYFAKERITGEQWNGSAYESIDFEPQLSDLDYLRSFKFEDLTYRGTVEFRSVCTQPVSEIMTSPAFHAGLMQKRNELQQFLDCDTVLLNRSRSSEELRELFNRGAWPDGLAECDLQKLLFSVLDFAAEGLRVRGYGEEHFLSPLYHRAKHLFSPAKQMVDGLRSGVALEYYIKEYAKL